MLPVAGGAGWVRMELVSGQCPLQCRMGVSDGEAAQAM